ncbi:MAG TPA: ATP-binding protein [Anaerolineales bacterium]|nr:ATP-binding protein [Anaerolineales bacterium]
MTDLPEDLNQPEALNSQELEAIYAISRVVTRATELDVSMDEIIGIARKVFIFDNVVLYFLQEAESLEPSYARAIGRGRNTEIDLAWGESIAQEVLESHHMSVKQEIAGDALLDRMNVRYFLGLPLAVGKHLMGALIFVRYGGPPFTPEHTHLAEYIAGHIAQLCEHGSLVTRLSRLEAERQLERLQDDFVATVSHELRTPLGFIKGYATTLLREDTQWDEATRREFLTIIDEEADRLRELIDNLLDSSRLESGTLHMEFQPLRVDTILKDIPLRARSFDENLIVELEFESHDIMVSADPTRMVQVFDNLLSNAVKYAPGSKVTVTLKAEGEMAHIAISDEGGGISPDHLTEIFSRFYRIPERSRSVRGTGLGLYICRRIIREHGGEITAESILGRGTTFNLFLPRIRTESGRSSFYTFPTSEEVNQ